MRILHIVHQFLPERVGGTETYTLGLAKGLVARGHEVAIFHRAPDEPGLVESAWDDIRTFRASAGPMTSASVFKATFGNRQLSQAFAATLGRFRPDVVHIQHLMGLPVSLASDINLSNKRYVITLHDYWSVCANAQLLTNYDNSLCNGPRWGGVNCGRCAIARAEANGLQLLAPAIMPIFARRNKLVRRVLQGADRVIAPSRFMAQFARKWDLPMNRLAYVPHGIDLPDTLSHAPRDERAKRFVYIGGLVPQKGVHVLAQTWAHLDRDAELAIYGDVDLYPDYRRRLESLSKLVRPPAYMTLNAKLTRADVWRVLSQADVLLFPSLWYENAPVIVQEAFAAGVPIIASRLGAISEWIADQQDGILVEPGDTAAWVAAVRRFVDERGLAAGFARRIKPPVSMNEHLNRVESIYAQTLSTGLAQRTS